MGIGGLVWLGSGVKAWKASGLVGGSPELVWAVRWQQVGGCFGWNGDQGVWFHIGLGVCVVLLWEQALI